MLLSPPPLLVFSVGSRLLTPSTWTASQQPLVDFDQRIGGSTIAFLHVTVLSSPSLPSPLFLSPPFPLPSPLLHSLLFPSLPHPCPPLTSGLLLPPPSLSLGCRVAACVLPFLHTMPRHSGWVFVKHSLCLSLLL